MNYRSSEVLAAESIATAGTKTIDINLKDVISRITLETQLTNVGDIQTGHPTKALTKIEIVDGSNVVFSMKGKAALALDYYDTGRPCFQDLTYLGGVGMYSVIHLNFGRYLWDEELALDPKRFNNLQLKITHNKALGGNAPTAGTLRVRADVFDEKVPSLRGFLCSKEHYSYTPTASGSEYIDLPTDYTLRKMLLQLYADSAYPWCQIDSLKLSEEHDKRVVLEGTIEDFIKFYSMEYPPYIEYVRCPLAATARNVYVTPTQEVMIVGNADDATAATVYVNVEGGGRQAVTASGYCNAVMLVKGWCPQGAVVFPFGKQSDMTDWYDVTRLGSCRLKLVAGGSIEASSTVEVITQQLRTY